MASRPIHKRPQPNLPPLLFYWHMIDKINSLYLSWFLPACVCLCVCVFFFWIQMITLFHTRSISPDYSQLFEIMPIFIALSFNKSALYWFFSPAYSMLRKKGFFSSPSPPFLFFIVFKKLSNLLHQVYLNFMMILKLDPVSILLHLILICCFIWSFYNHFTFFLFKKGTWPIKYYTNRYQNNYNQTESSIFFISIIVKQRSNAKVYHLIKVNVPSSSHWFSAS